MLFSKSTHSTPPPSRQRSFAAPGLRVAAPAGSPPPAALPWKPNPERRNMRIRLAAQDVRAVFDNRISCKVIDVSEGGMCLETERPLPYVSGASLRFDQVDLTVPVRIAWSKLVMGGAGGPRYRCGVQFLEPTFDQIRTLLELAAA